MKFQRSLVLFITAILIILILPLFYDEGQKHVHAYADHDRSKWHSPTDHEHGDAPPQWVIGSGYPSGYDSSSGFLGATSVIENVAKHTSMKGFAATFKDKQGQNQEVYLRAHIASHVMERSVRYHSYQFFLRDSSGVISMTQGWMNSGDPNGRRTRMQGDNGIRPILLVVDPASYQASRNCEQWYNTTSRQGWGPDFGWTICNSTSFWFAEEAQYQEYPGGIFYTKDYGMQSPYGLDRELELSWYRFDSVSASNRGSPPINTEFYATQFGDVVSGINDPVCSSTTERFGQQLNNICLVQIIKNTAKSIENVVNIPNANRMRKVFPGSGVTVPN